MTRDWDAHFIRRAWLNAEMTTCHRRSVGAVAVRDRRTFADGFNGNLPGELHCVDGGCLRCDDTSRGSGVSLGDCVCVHAEENVVTYCARTGTPLAGATIYTTTKPCLTCYKLLYNSGVVEVVYHTSYPSVLPDLPRMRIRQVTTDA